MGHPPDTEVREVDEQRSPLGREGRKARREQARELAKELLRTNRQEQTAKHLNVGDSISLLGLLFGVVLVIVVPTVLAKALLLMGVCAGSCWFVGKSHWTHEWSTAKKYSISTIIVIILWGLAIPQFMSEWRAQLVQAQNLRDMSNLEIKRKERELTNSMRQLEANFFKQDAARNPAETFDVETERHIKAHADFELQFRIKYLNDAAAMRCELLRRLDEPCPPVTIGSNGPPVWDKDIRLHALTGRLPGPSPLTDLANYLDELSHRLQ
jgi:hypothetical protein